MRRILFLTLVAAVILSVAPLYAVDEPSTNRSDDMDAAGYADPLPSWNDGPTKQAIVDFVARVTTPGGEDFVAEAERVAVFDNDGTLWPEQPLYVQYVFAFDRVAALLPEHPEWEEQEKFRAVLSKDLGRLATLTQRDILDVAAASHGGTTTEEFKRIVGDWLASARHPRFGRPYTECVYQPMLELLAYLRG
ncbi:MAG: haloacid dehalogenase-like hydrolase, partial [bacterium]